MNDDFSTKCPSILSCIVSSIFPCFWASSFETLPQQQEMVVLNFGKVKGVIREPGLYCINPVGTETKKIYTSLQSFDIPQQKVVDVCGNPILVSGVVTMRIIDAKRALIDVVDCYKFLKTQSEVVLRQICSMYAYESRNEMKDQFAATESLTTENGQIKAKVIELLQKKVSDAGVAIISFEFKEISYAPEIASNMLVKQQAQAKLDARHIIVDGAVNIATNAINQLKKNGIAVSDQESSRLVGNLVLTICGESNIQPVINLGS